jgi:murein DD-endopeptidase MepM/ murein hydrolase activator NlpD
MRLFAILFVSLTLAPGKTPAGGAEQASAPLELSLPTENKSIFERRPESFYMGVDRDGKRVWEGGTFGFVRSPMVWPGGAVCTQFHEGIDIAPVKKHAGAIPSDEVRAISAGTVVLAETNGRTRYGNQVVCRHEWFGGPVFSRYAHLNGVNVAAGEKVTRDQLLGVIGHTGGALTAERAHLHLEVNLMRNESFERSWLPPQDVNSGDPMFHPANFAGVDAAALFVALRANPALTFPDFVRSHAPYFTVAMAADRPVDLLKRHSWLGDGKSEAPGWKISFTEWGLPIRFEVLAEPPTEPRVVWVRPFEGKHAWRTGGLLSGTGETASLNTAGLALMRIIFGPR